MDAQADLSLRKARMSKCMFSHVAAQFRNKNNQNNQNTDSTGG